MLDLCMEVASSLPQKAHSGVRSRLQVEVVRTDLERSTADRALDDAKRITDWRQGEALALIAQSLARHGDRDRALACLQRASRIAEGADGWKLERLRTEMGVAHAMLGDVETARRLAAQVPQELTGRVESQLSGIVPLEEVDRQCDAFDRAIATGSFDVVRSGIDGYFAAWERLEADPSRSARAESAIRAALPGLPIDLQVDAHLRLSRALRHAGRAKAADQELAAAEDLLARFEFTTEIRGTIVRDIARARARSGDAGSARRLLEDALALYQRDRRTIVDIDQADFLRPLAEAFHEAGDADAAHATWRLALEAGSANPNARPRAEDLCLTGLSMVRSGAEPSSEDLALMRRIREGLKAPW